MELNWPKGSDNKRSTVKKNNEKNPTSSKDFDKKKAITHNWLNEKALNNDWKRAIIPTRVTDIAQLEESELEKTNWYRWKKHFRKRWWQTSYNKKNKCEKVMRQDKNQKFQATTSESKRIEENDVTTQKKWSYNWHQKAKKRKAQGKKDADTQ